MVGDVLFRRKGMRHMRREVYFFMVLVVIFFNLSEENACRIQRALVAFGFRADEVPIHAFTTLGNVLTFGIIPSRVDLINEIDAVSYEEARKRMVRGKYGRVEVSFIGFEDLVRNKKATPRTRDKGDVEELTQQD